MYAYIHVKTFKCINIEMCPNMKNVKYMYKYINVSMPQYTVAFFWKQQITYSVKTFPNTHTHAWFWISNTLNLHQSLFFFVLALFAIWSWHFQNISFAKCFYRPLHPLPRHGGYSVFAGVGRKLSQIAPVGRVTTPWCFR